MNPAEARQVGPPDRAHSHDVARVGRIDHQPVADVDADVMYVALAKEDQVAG